MEAHNGQVDKKSSGSSFDITLEETLKVLYERRLEVIRRLRSLELEKRERLEQGLSETKAAC